MELASGGSASSHESNSLKARYPLSATVCPVRRRLQRSFFAAGPHKIASPIGVNQEGDTRQYSTLGSSVRNVVVQYEEYVLHGVVLAAPLSYKAPGHTRVASASVSFVFTVMYRTSFTLWTWGKLDVGGKIQFTYILGQILSGWFTKSGLQVASPPRDTSMGEGRDDGDGRLVIFAATGREERWPIWVWRGKRYEYSTTLYYFLHFESIPWRYFTGDPKSIPLLVGCPFPSIFTSPSYNLYFYR